MRIAPIALLVASAFVAACDDSNINLIIPSRTSGTFILVSANGQSLPAVIVDSVNPPLRIAVLSGSITLNTDNTFGDVAVFSRTEGSVVTRNTVACSGTFVVNGNVLTFQEFVSDGCGDRFTGVLSGNTLTTTIRAVPAVYVR